MDAAFDMQTEIADLAARIIGPVAANLAPKELDTAVAHIRLAFGQLSTGGAPTNGDFEKMAVNILAPLRAKLCEADFTRIVDRLRGAMAGFCQRDEAEAEPDARLQQAGLREALDPQQSARCEPATANPWWSTSEEAMLLLLLLWLCTEVQWRLQ
jgi:hypothetical protein